MVSALFSLKGRAVERITFMRMNEVVFTSAVPVDGYGPGFFRIGGQVVEGSVLISDTGVRGWGGYDDAEPLLALAGKVDVLLIGTGEEVAHIPASLRHQLEEAGLGVESMTSPAACRTYNVLLSEGRRIAAAVLAV
jgi:uncharacterized protein